jgi:serine/threonine-protein kinase
VAWSGSYPEAPEIPIHIEAAAFQGKPVYFAQYGPWSKPPTPSQASGDEKPAGDVVYVVLQLIVVLGSVPFARYNLRLGRGDTRGAFRVGLFATAVGMLAWLIGGAHVANVNETDLFFMSLMRALFGGVSTAVTYISFEPFVRRKWPQTIISWSRLLTGGFRDPLVGRDVLVGTALGLVLGLIQGAGTLAYGLLGTQVVRAGIRYAALAGGRSMVGESLYLIDDALYKALGILFLIFLARTLLRRQWLAAGVITIALAGIIALNEPSQLIGWPVNIVFFGVMVLTLMRCGLLTMAIALLVSTFLGSFPLGTDFSVWYVAAIVFTIAVVLAPAVFGFRTALAGQPLFVED